MKEPAHSTRRASVDTNASAIAHSTISIGQIAKFPEPPSSIPSSPVGSTFAAAAARQLPIPPRPPQLKVPAPLHPRRLPQPPPSFIPQVDPSHSFVQPSNNPQTTSSSTISNSTVSAHDWHDGASSIDANTVLPNTLPTSFITALLQENKIQRRSTASLALSGISETPYSRNSLGRYRGQYDSSLTAADSPTPPLLPSYNSESSALATVTGCTPSATPVRSKSFASSETFKSSDGLLEKRPDCVDVNELGTSRAQPHHPTASRPKPQHGPSLSVRSSKTFLTRHLSLRHLFVRKTKPLPPVPILPDISLAQQRTQHELEMSSALPDLINRASTLRRMLENGHRPHSSSGSFEVISLRNTPPIVSDTQDGKHNGEAATWSNPRSSWYQKFQHTYTRRKRIVIARLFILIIFLILGLVLGLVLGLRKHLQISCPEGKVGSKCNINANCVCTSATQCNGLAKAVIDLLPSVDSVFKTNYTTALAYSSFWLMEGGSQSNNCTPQAVILDVGDSLDQANFPNRTQWTQTALLWNALKTQDLVAALQLQNFVQSLPWNKLSASDGPVNNMDSAVFSITVSGYTFNFASQTVTQPPVSFATLFHPSDAQMQKFSPATLAAMDRMYTYAQASSTQQQAALQKYWTSVLLQRADTLPIFKDALSVFPLMLPFNASSRTIRDQYPSAASLPFPPPLSCFPNVDPALQQQVSMFETATFGLPTIRSNQTGFNSSCYRDRPVYGILDVLQLRLPFRDDIPSVAQHAAVLNRDLNSRVVFSIGKGFSGIFNGIVSLTPSQLDPRQYGTTNFLDHVILQYLTSIGDINIVNSLVKFILDTKTAVRVVPPDPSSTLYQAMKTLSPIEVAVFGDVTPSDFSSIVSPFAIESGALFFGSEDGAVLRNWTIGTAHLPVVWTQNATSSLVVRDNSLGDNPVTRMWNSVSVALSRQETTIGVVNITDALMGTMSW